MESVDCEGCHTNCSEFAPDMHDHDDGHNERCDVHKICGHLENDGVCQLDTTGVACRVYPCGTGDGRGRPHDRAHRKRRFPAYPAQVAENHIDSSRVEPKPNPNPYDGSGGATAQSACLDCPRTRRSDG